MRKGVLRVPSWMNAMPLSWRRGGGPWNAVLRVTSRINAVPLSWRRSLERRSSCYFVDKRRSRGGEAVPGTPFFVLLRG